MKVIHFRFCSYMVTAFLLLNYFFLKKAQNLFFFLVSLKSWKWCVSLHSVLQTRAKVGENLKSSVNSCHTFESNFYFLHCKTAAEMGTDPLSLLGLNSPFTIHHRIPLSVPLRNIFSIISTLPHPPPPLPSPRTHHTLNNLIGARACSSLFFNVCCWFEPGLFWLIHPQGFVVLLPYMIINCCFFYADCVSYLVEL